MNPLIIGIIAIAVLAVFFLVFNNRNQPTTTLIPMRLPTFAPITQSPTTQPPTTTKKIDNELIVAIGINNHIWTKRKLDDYWVGPISCCVKSITQLKDGTILGIGLDDLMYKKKNLNELWTGAIKNSCCINHITQFNDGTIIGIGGVVLFKKNNLEDPWVGIDKSCCKKSVIQLKDGTILGVGTDSRLWKKKNNNINEEWEGPLPNTCCVDDIAELNDGTLLGIGGNRLYKKNKLEEQWIGPIDDFHISKIIVFKNY
jgi:hypothetical protein